MKKTRSKFKRLDLKNVTEAEAIVKDLLKRVQVVRQQVEALYQEDVRRSAAKKKQ